MEKPLEVSIHNIDSAHQRLFLPLYRSFITAGPTLPPDRTGGDRSNKSAFGASEQAILCVFGHYPSTVNPRISQLFSFSPDMKYWMDLTIVDETKAELLRFSDISQRRVAMIFGGQYDPRSHTSVNAYCRMISRIGQLVEECLEVKAEVSHPPKNDPDQTTALAVNTEEGLVRVAQSSRVTPISRKTFPYDRLDHYRHLWVPERRKVSA